MSDRPSQDSLLQSPWEASEQGPTARQPCAKESTSTFRFNLDAKPLEPPSPGWDDLAHDKARLAAKAGRSMQNHRPTLPVLTGQDSLPVSTEPAAVEGDASFIYSHEKHAEKHVEKHPATHAEKGAVPRNCDDAESAYTYCLQPAGKYTCDYWVKALKDEGGEFSGYSDYSDNSDGDGTESDVGYWKRYTDWFNTLEGADRTRELEAMELGDTFFFS